jgi:hypothetical protein
MLKEFVRIASVAEEFQQTVTRYDERCSVRIGMEGEPLMAEEGFIDKKMYVVCMIIN